MKEASLVGRFLRVCCHRFIQLDLDHQVLVSLLGVIICRRRRRRRLRRVYNTNVWIIIIIHGYLLHKCSIIQRWVLNYRCRASRSIGVTIRHYLNLGLLRWMGVEDIIIINNNNNNNINNSSLVNIRWVECIMIVSLSQQKHMVGVVLLSN